MDHHLEEIQATLFSNLFKNASEGFSSAPIVGVMSELPSWSRATILYNGPVGMWDFEHETVRSWFDGQSLLQSFIIDPDSMMVKFQKRFLQSDAFAKAKANGRLIITEYGSPGSSDPDKNIVARAMSSLVPGEMTDNCACSFYQFGGLVVASTETCLLRVINPDTLDTLDKIDMSGLVNIASARALTDANGDLYNLTGTFTSGLKYHFVKFPKNHDEKDPAKILASGKIIATIPSRMTTCFSYYHTFGMSDKYLVMIEQPWVANSLKLIASKIKGLSFKDCLEWHPDEKNRFYVVEKASGKVIKTKYFSNNPFFFLNFINVFEEDDCLVVDVLGYDSPDLLDNLDLEKLRTGKFAPKDESRFLRYVLPLPGDDKRVEDVALVAHGQAKITFEDNKVWLSPHSPLTETGCEHPIVNANFRGKPYTFCYVIGWMNSINKGFFANAITKVNMTTGETVSWRGGDFSHPSEAVFIPNPEEPDKEDAGIVVAAVTDTRDSEKDFVVFLDARQMTELGRSNFDSDIAFCSHALRL